MEELSEENFANLKKSICNKILKLPKVSAYGSVYYQYSELSLTREEFFHIVVNKELGKAVRSELKLTDDLCSIALYRVGDSYADLYDKILRLSNVSASIKIKICNKGFFDDFSLLDEWIVCGDKYLSRFAAEYCRKELLEKGLKSNDSETRLIIYKRIGIEESLDAMLKDKSKDIRKVAVKFLNRSDPRLIKMASDKSVEVLNVLAKKLDKDDLAHILKNPKAFSGELSRTLNRRS